MNYRNTAKDYNDAFGFNVIPLIDKAPNGSWKEWLDTEMEVNQIDSLGWNAKVNGIGAVSGINNLRCLDFDDVEDINIVYEIAEELGLGKGYAWIVKSGSGKGYHIWFYCIDEDNYLEGLGGEKAYYKYKLRRNGLCDHVELRWKNCQTVLPPSQHPSGNQYEFVNDEHGLPVDEPKPVWIGKLLEVLKLKCRIETQDVRREKNNRKAKSKILKSYERKLLKDAADYLRGSVDNYDDWYKMGFALASLSEEGREYFINISSDNPKYDDSEAELSKKYDSFLKDYRGDITLGTFFELAKNYGWEKPKKRFWRLDDKKATIIRSELIELLEEEGFGKLFVGRDHIYIRVQDNIVSEVTVVNIKDFVLQYIESSINESWIRRSVKESIMKSSRNIFSDGALEFIHEPNLDFVKDSKERAYFFFENCFVEVNRTEIRERPYNELAGVIWERQKIKRKYEKADSESVYKKFLYNVSSQDDERFISLKSVIGYLLHGYKNPACNKAVIFIDEKLSENAFGRSGKGLVAEALAQMRNLIQIDGRNFNFNKSFAFQSVNIDTEIISFDDVKKNFYFDRLFSIITEDFTIEKKNRNEFRIPFEEAPKILITTNYSIQGSDDSSIDRQFVIEFSDYYNAKHKPTDDFGHLFFYEWNEEEFKKFDNLMMECCQLYLREGLKRYEYVNLTKKKIIDETTPEFEEFINSIELGREYNKKDLFNKFKEEYEDFDKMKQQTFTKWINVWANLNEYDVHRRKTGNKRFVIITRKGELPKFNDMLDL